MLRDYWEWEECVRDLDERMSQLERLVQYPNAVNQDMRVILKAQAAQQQAMTGVIHPGDASACDPARTMPPHMVYKLDENLYAPLRSDTRAVIDLAAFARRLIDMQDLGHAVTEEVRELAKRALGLK